VAAVGAEFAEDGPAAAMLERDPATAQRFVDFVKSEIDEAFRKGNDAGKNVAITVITESRYYDSIWRKSASKLLFALLQGDAAMPSTAIVALFGEKAPPELRDLVNTAEPGRIRVYPKPAINDTDYLNEITRQSAELAVSA